MTDFEKIKAYYSVFDEQHRLENAEGRLEYDICKSIILGYLNKSDCILDLGGGAGKYSIELAKQGYKVTLADLSERLLEQAKAYIEENNIPEHNFSQILLRSIRSFGHNKEEKLYELFEKDISLFKGRTNDYLYTQLLGGIL